MRWQKAVVYVRTYGEHKRYGKNIEWSRAQRGGHTRHSVLAEPLDFHTVPSLKWWLLCHQNQKYHLRGRLHTHMYAVGHSFHSSCIPNPHIHSCFQSGSLGKQCKEIELSFAYALLHLTHQFPGILALPQLTLGTSQTLDCCAMSRGRPLISTRHLKKYTNR